MQKMQKMRRFISICFVLLALLNIANAQEQKRALQGVPFTSVHFEDAFWSPRIETNRKVSIPHNINWCEDTGRFANFSKAAKLMDGNFEGIYFNDSDVYKLLEGIAYTLSDKPDADLERQADEIIARIAAAQQPNGYLNTYYELKEPDKKWTNTRVMHELYCAGHLIEAAVAYKRATNKDSLLNVAEKFVRHIMDTFGRETGKKVEVPGHEEIELALVKLYQLTGKKEYLDLATFFIDVRGDQSVRTDKLQGKYSQDHEPIRKASEIVGHAVRAVYLYAGVADVASYSGDAELIAAMGRLWNDVVNKKMYITGGIGARHEGEAFGDAFELPNKSAYCETCAAIGLAFWANRLNLLSGDPKYADVLETAIYNGVLAGIGQDGKSFFYVNPLESTGGHRRQPFFDCACCPTNVVRFLPSLPGYQYAVDKNGDIYVNLFVSGKAEIKLPGGIVTIQQKTRYPFKENVSFDIQSKGNQTNPFKVFVRVPGESKYEELTVCDWNKSYEAVNFTVPMYPKRMLANPLVVADRGRVAIKRGPIVYCFEQADNDVPIAEIVLARKPELETQIIGTMDNKGNEFWIYGAIYCKNADGRKLKAVPYYSWAHREDGAMAVWVKQQGLSKKPDVNDPNWTNSETNEPILYRELSDDMLKSDKELAGEAETSVSVSYCGQRDTPEAIIDGLEPKSSNDDSIPRHTFWPHKGTNETVEIDFGKPKEISKVSVYWFDDTGKGQCRVPESSKLFAKQGDNWTPVAALGVAKDGFNTLSFDKIETQKIRIEVKLQSEFSGGVLEIKH